MVENSQVKKVFGKRGKTEKNLHKTSEKLAVPSGSAMFTLEEIPADQIDKLTFVSPFNPRQQEWLTEAGLHDILPDVKKYGQTKPAYGRWVENNGERRIEVLEGSRRRVCTKLANRTYKILTAKTLSDEDALYIVKISVNEQRPLSIYERGSQILAFELGAGQELNQRELAKATGFPLTVVNTAIRTHRELPIEVIEAYPDINELGRPTLEKLLKLWKQASDHGQESLILDVARELKGASIDTIEAEGGVSAYCQEVTKKLLTSVSISKPATPTSGTQKIGDGKGKYKRTKKGINLTLGELDDSSIERLIEFASSLYQK